MENYVKHTEQDGKYLCVSYAVLVYLAKTSIVV